MELRIKTLQEQLEARKIESFLLKKEQKKLRLENLKAKEQDLLKQIEFYDKKIEESKKSLMVDVEKKNIKIKQDFSSKSSNYFYPVEIRKSIDHNFTSLEKPMNEKNIVIKSKTNFNKYTGDCGLEDTDDFNLEKNICEVVLLPKEASARDVKTSKEAVEIIQTGINNIFLKSQPSNSLVDSSTEKIQSNNLKTINDTKTPNIFSNQALYLEKNMNSEKLPISSSNVDNNHSNFSSSSNSDNERKLFVDFNETDNVCKKNKNNTNPLEVSNNDIEVDNDYSLDFTSVENTSECQKSYDNIKELQDEEQNYESSSYEEERSEGDIIFEDKTFIEKFSDDCNEVSKN